MRRFHAGLFTALVALWGCVSAPLKAVITDRQGTQTEVFAVQTDAGPTLEVLNGLARAKVRLNELSVLEISPGQVKSIDGDLYYLAELWLADGSKMEPASLPDGRRTEPYVNIAARLVAKTKNGSFTIPLKDVKQLRFVPAE